jgi:hypothetical protein
MALIPTDEFATNIAPEQHSRPVSAKEWLMKRLAMALATVALSGWVTPVQATPITYTETGTGSGMLDGTVFTNALVTLTLTGDTSSVTNGSAINCVPCFVNPGSATVSVFGVRTDTFTDSIEAVLAPFPAFGNMAGVVIVDQLHGIGMLGTISNALLTYDLTSSFGPISGRAESSTPGQSGGEAVFNTTLGSFFWTSVPDAATFTATASSPAPVPEPASIILLGTGLFALCARRLRRGKASGA